MNHLVKDELHHVLASGRRMIKILVYSILCGIIVGLVSSGFAALMNFVTALRLNHPLLILLLPGAGILVVGVYHLLHNEQDTGTNLVIAALQSKDDVPLKMAPSLFIGTIITHHFGGLSLKHN